MATVYDALGGPADKKQAVYKRGQRVDVVDGIYKGEKGLIVAVDNDIHGRACYKVTIDESYQDTVLAEHEVLAEHKER